MEKNVSPDILMHVKIYGTNPHKSVPICVDGTKRLSFGIFSRGPLYALYSV